MEESSGAWAPELMWKTWKKHLVLASITYRVYSTLTFQLVFQSEKLTSVMLMIVSGGKCWSSLVGTGGKLIFFLTDPGLVFNILLVSNKLSI